MLFFVLLILLSLSFAIAFRERLIETTALSAMVIIVVLYVSGLFSSFLPGLYVVILGTLLFFLIELVYNRKCLRELFKQLFLDIGTIEYLLVLVIVYFFTRNKMFHGWDEFSHWGLVIKNFFINNDFATADNSNVGFLAYPPGMPLLSYFAEKLSLGGFKEGLVYLAYDTFMLSLLFSAFRLNDNNRKSTKYICIAAVAPLIPLMFSGNEYQTSYVDAVLGLLTGYIIFTHYTQKDCRLKWLNILFALFTLSIIKESGFGLALIAILIIAIPDIWSKSFKSILLVIPPVLGNCSWSLWLKMNNISKGKLSSENIFQRLSDQKGLLPYQKEVIFGGFREFYRGRIQEFSAYTCITWMTIILCIVIYLTIRKKEYKRYIVAIWGILAGLCLYTMSLIITFMFNFGQEEAVVLSSYNRYMMTYILAGTFVVVFMLIDIFSNNKLAHFLILMIILAHVSLSFMQSLVRSDRAVYSMYSTKNYEYINLDELQTIVKQDKICFVHYSDSEDDSADLDLLVFKNYIAPAKAIATDLYWSDGLGKPVDNPTTPKEWLKMLEESDSKYIYLDTIDDNFIALYGDMFESEKEISSKTIYEVDQNSGKIYCVKRFEG